MEGRATVAVYSAIMKASYIAEKFDWLAEYVETKMGKIYNCFIVEISRLYYGLFALARKLDDIYNILAKLLSFLMDYTTFSLV